MRARRSPKWVAVVAWLVGRHFGGVADQHQHCWLLAWVEAGKLRRKQNGLQMREMSRARHVVQAEQRVHMSVKTEQPDDGGLDLGNLLAKVACQCAEGERKTSRGRSSMMGQSFAIQTHASANWDRV